MRSRFMTSTASGSTSGLPDEEASTGSRTAGTRGFSPSTPATAAMIEAFASMPILMAATSLACNAARI
ncbi:hypothetical protein AU467_23005 [Mesorhizobium loti]|uniref:Uncharacterized protein n=1 Tax=Rhizobium loti TaxID=381 RepID=A0A101KSY3_RHILI|nr:hypothetical protein AU467_23005 [Mesorhizobium loti]